MKSLILILTFVVPMVSQSDEPGYYYKQVKSHPGGSLCIAYDQEGMPKMLLDRGEVCKFAPTSSTSLTEQQLIKVYEKQTELKLSPFAPIPIDSVITEKDSDPLPANQQLVSTLRGCNRNEVSIPEEYQGEYKVKMDYET